jgi:predicted PurR-regulated permease PerM
MMHSKTRFVFVVSFIVVVVVVLYFNSSCQRFIGACGSKNDNVNTSYNRSSQSSGPNQIQHEEEEDNSPTTLLSSMQQQPQPLQVFILSGQSNMVQFILVVFGIFVYFPNVFFQSSLMLRRLEWLPWIT